MARPAEDAPSDDEVTEVVELADATEPDVTEEISTDEVEAHAAGADESTVEVEQITEVVATESAVETPSTATSRRRLPWRRTKAAPVVPDEPVTEVVETAAGATDVVDTEVVEPETTAAAAEAEADSDSEADSAADEPEPVLVPHRTAPKGLKIATAVAAALVIAAAGFAAAMLQPYRVERANVQIKQRVAETAAAAITTLWSYTPEDIDTLGDRTSGYLGGDFAAQYRDFIDSIVEANKQAQQEEHERDHGGGHVHPRVRHEPEAEEDHVSGHVGDEHVPEDEHTDGVDEAGRERQQQQPDDRHPM